MENDTERPMALESSWRPCLCPGWRTKVKIGGNFLSHLGVGHDWPFDFLARCWAPRSPSRTPWCATRAKASAFAWKCLWGASSRSRSLSPYNFVIGGGWDVTTMTWAVPADVTTSAGLVKVESLAAGKASYIVAVKSRVCVVLAVIPQSGGKQTSN